MLYFLHFRILKCFVKTFVTHVSSVKPATDSHAQTPFIQHHVSTVMDLLDFMVGPTWLGGEEDQLVEGWWNTFLPLR